MAILWGSTYLSGDPDQNGYDCTSDGPVFSGSDVVQEDAIVRSPRPSRIPRGNASRDASFSVARQFDSFALATAFAEAHPAVFLGAVDTVTWESGAIWPSSSVSAQCRTIGVLVMTSYRIRGVIDV